MPIALKKKKKKVASVFTLSHLYHVIYKCRYSGFEKAKHLLVVIPVSGPISAIDKIGSNSSSCPGTLQVLFIVVSESPNC